jgi:hypothetical protein
MWTENLEQMHHLLLHLRSTYCINVLEKFASDKQLQKQNLAASRHHVIVEYTSKCLEKAEYLSYLQKIG